MNDSAISNVPAKTAKKIAKAVAAAPTEQPMTASAEVAAIAAQPVAIEPAPVAEPVSPEPAPAVVPEPVTTKGPTMTETFTAAVDQTKNFAQDAQGKATALFADWNGRTKAAVERSTKMFEELNDFNKGNVEALVESSRVAAKAAETLGQQAAETARKNFEQATATLKSFASVKTPTELFQLQSEAVRTAFDQAIADTSRNSETMLKLVGEVFQPISNRFAVAAEKIKTAA